MKRDLDLIRKILLRIENQPHDACGYSLSMEGYDQGIVDSHLDLMLEANLIKGHVLRHQGVVAQFLVDGLTWGGHDFIDASKNDTVWAAAKEKVLKPGLSFTFDLLKEWLKAESAKYLGSI
ncbi:DUF2513 domain-containing protein [Chromobacterium sphagni]|uniref:DUF2513 domain-containing protein n=1 Tax=Chromobacterium sphagni TaxID=1903179 RepID=UPI0009F6621D|nr:DUF2513 domain-containing protein [Chromobacterium sphagni]